MIEIHPFKPFVPVNSETLILGSFPGKESTLKPRENDWFYCANRNQFWKILELVFKQNLSLLDDKQNLFDINKTAITDIILSCERRDSNNTDDNLINKTYNFEEIYCILTNNPVKRILFTSKGVFKEFLINFRKPENIDLIVLPSPSPIYRKLSLQDKADEYSKHLRLV